MLPMWEGRQPSGEGVTVVAPLQAHSPHTLRKAQLDDPTIGPAVRAMAAKENLKPDAIARGGPAVRQLVQLWDRLFMENGILKRQYEGVRGHDSWTQFVVPLKLRDEILNELHSDALEGHLGEDKTVGKVRERFYWPGMQRDVIQWIRTCPECATRKSPSQRPEDSSLCFPYAGGRSAYIRPLTREYSRKLIYISSW